MQNAQCNILINGKKAKDIKVEQFDRNTKETTTSRPNNANKRESIKKSRDRNLNVCFAERRRHMCLFRLLK